MPQRDYTLAEPGQSVEWKKACRDCGREQTSGVAISMALSALFAVAAVAVFWLWSPMLGAIMMIGAVGGLGVTMIPVVIERVTRWLSAGR
jgi:hypothetical protein